MSGQQQILNLVTKQKKLYMVAGRGLLRGNHLHEKFKQMTFGTGAPARKKIAEEMGGSVRHHNRPYRLKDTEPKNRPVSNQFNSNYNFFLYLY